MDSGKLPTKTRLFDPQVFVFYLKKTTNKVKPPPTNKPNRKF